MPNSIGIRSDYLENLCKKIIYKFDKVLPCDLFLDENIDCTKESYYILNLDISKNPGTHYVALAIRKKKVIFFDSFGRKLKNKFIVTKLMNLGFTNLTYSNMCVQSPLDSKLCSYFCVAFLISIQEKSFEKFLSLFNETDLMKNDRICINIIKEQIEKSMK